MIQREAWHTEVASLERQREMLHQMYDRGELSAEEFAQKMHRLWKGGKGGGFLETSESGGLFTTPEWIYRNQATISELESLYKRYRKITYGGWRSPEGMTLRLQDSPRWISQEVLKSQLSLEQVNEATTLLALSPYIKPGEDVNSWVLAGRRDIPVASEEEFNAWFQEKSENAKLLVESYEAWIKEQGLINTFDPYSEE